MPGRSIGMCVSFIAFGGLPEVAPASERTSSASEACACLRELLAQLGNDMKLQPCVGEKPASQRGDWNAICADQRQDFD